MGGMVDFWTVGCASENMLAMRCNNMLDLMPYAMHNTSVVCCIAYLLKWLGRFADMICEQFRVIVQWP